MRPCEGSEGWDGSAHPDNVSNDKYKLCVSGIRKIKDKLAPRMRKCYVWMDFSCIDQDNRKKIPKELKRFDKIMECCDLIFTPLFDLSWEKLISTGWTDGPHIYINRGWCRVEMLHAANIPVLGNVNAAVKRHTMFEHTLAINCRFNIRPHLFYTTELHERNSHPLVLPPLQDNYLAKFHPEHGHFTVPSDLNIVKILMTQLQPYLEANKVVYGYTGDVNEAGEKHGSGTLIDKAGFKYDGEWKNGKMNGKGLLLLEPGTYYEGEFENDMYNGEGSFNLSSGSYWKGTWKYHKLHGIGTHLSDKGDLYEGEWNAGVFHGKGIMKYANGDTYEGEWKYGKREGQGTLRRADGFVIVAIFKGDKPI